MKKTPLLSKLLLSILSCFLLFSCQEVSKHKTLKLAHGLDPTHPVHKAMLYMAQELEQISDGQMSLEIYPSGQLGSEQQCVELIQLGSLAITKVSAAIMEGFTNNYQVLGLPYVFRSKAHTFNVLDGSIGEELLASTEKFNLKGLCFYDAGARSFYTIDKSIDTPEDLKGLKMRVMKSQTAINMVKALGGSPTPISWGELYTALQSGVVDGAENNPPSLYTSHHYEVCKNYSLNEHTRVPDVLIISTVVWNKLSNQQQKWLQEAAKKSVIEQRKLWAASEEESLEKLKENGVIITYPKKDKFAERVQDLLDAYQQQPELYQLIQRIQATQD
ncbi:C4-dicarboxylate ABC transporter substrate-binding protein [Labilibaculum filiforme]|uniref:C4-dicarboxylate ABC transporter substrate-binding protein n=1 Tax=Labilibaculum filiforme TaxID=1940526 RepID=A0A2N3I424_9BACT|nr:TRAP transporter substrate-binding protein [Labilibaculum filiforme]PKQ65055.1 C4-dicarboxylate ABC transporter substrate-binding protein [Labilibaculum filiforme]